MIVKFLFSAPTRDIPVGPDDLVKPFKITPSKNHTFLTLGDYFKSIKSLMLKDNGTAMIPVLGEDMELNRIDRMLIRSEKHGALYHLASVEIFMDSQSCKLAVSTAISEKGRSLLAHEYEVLIFLDRTWRLPYLPKPYFKGDVYCRTGTSKETLSMFVAHWFDGYHEWHFSFDESGQKKNIRIWDQECGYRFASKEETFEIFRQASKILTLYYDTENFSEVFPWHHAAGDFVVRSRNGIIDVRLTTARNYKSCMVFESENDANPMVAIIWFFLNMTLKMRLDKLDGVGAVVWAGPSCVEAVNMGFFEALRMREEKGSYQLGKVVDLLMLLKALSREELGRLFFSVFDFYRPKNPVDFSVIKTHLEDHVNQLYQVMQNFRL